MKTETVFINIFVIAIFLLIINYIYQNFNKNGNSSSVVEGFATNDYVLSTARRYRNTIYESSLIKEFPNSKRLFCNLVPTSKTEDCRDVNNQIISKDRIPVHIIKELKKGKYLAVFNDGKIYRKDNISDTFWKGPIKRSLIRGNIPPRMITLDSSGEKLIGVGYDNNLYIKKKKEYNSEWQKITDDGNLIYVIYDSDKRLIGIDRNGQIVKQETKELNSYFLPIESEETKMLKLYWDKNGYLLGLGTDFRLYKKSGSDWLQNQWDLVKGKNPIPINDAIYDVDGRMYGLVILPGPGTLELMKQQDAYYLSEFAPLDVIEASDPTMKELDIIKLKTGIDFSETDEVDGEEDDFSQFSLNLLYQKQLSQDKHKLYGFCKKKGYIGKVPYSNYELQNKVNEQDRYINKINKEISNLIRMDPARLKLQEVDMSQLS